MKDKEFEDALQKVQEDFTDEVEERKAQIDFQARLACWLEDKLSDTEKFIEATLRIANMGFYEDTLVAVMSLLIDYYDRSVNTIEVEENEDKKKWS